MPHYWNKSGALFISIDPERILPNSALFHNIKTQQMKNRRKHPKSDKEHLFKNLSRGFSFNNETVNFVP